MIDSHCHLADEAFLDDLDAVIERARDAGVEGVLCILAAGAGAELERGSALATRWRAVRLATGVHPHQAGDHAGDPAQASTLVERVVRQVGASAIGEIGLDYHYDQAPRDLQVSVLREQLRLAHRLGLPVIVHTRDAEEDTFRVLEEEGGDRLSVVFHCFTGDRAMAARALDLGGYISLSGIVTFANAEELRAVARAVPSGRLLVETDAPYLAPVPCRGGRNEPAWLRHTLERVAEVRGESVEDVVSSTSRAFEAAIPERRQETGENH